MGFNVVVSMEARSQRLGQRREQDLASLLHKRVQNYAQYMHVGGGGDRERPGQLWGKAGRLLCQGGAGGPCRPSPVPEHVKSHSTETCLKMHFRKLGFTT